MCLLSLRRNVNVLIPRSEDLSPQSPEKVLGLVGGTGSESDFGRVEGTSPLCLQVKERAL